MSFKIVTVCNRFPQESYYCLTEWFKSLKGEQPLVLGQQPGQYGGLGSKPRLLYSAIKEGLIPEKHIVFCDSFDLVFAVEPKQLFLKYLQFSSPFVISAEKNCYPADLKEQYDKLAEDILSPYKYLNSGMIVAETEAMLTVLEAMDAPNIPNDYWSEEKNCMINPNDQEYYQQQFLKQPVHMVLDRWQILCRTLHDADISELDLSGDQILNMETKTFPCSFHFNGNGKSGNCRNPILQHLNLL